jgi:hypothetical protein
VSSLRKRLFRRLYDEAFMRRFHGTAVILWIFPGIPISVLLSQQVAYVVFLSVYAIIGFHWIEWVALNPNVKSDIGPDAEPKG